MTKKIYIVGIEGAGTSALAQIYVSQGHSVSGSDDGDGFYRAQLAEMGIHVHSDFDVAHVPADANMVVHSTAFGVGNSEIAAAQAQGLRVVPYPQAVAELFNTTMGIAVCGTHGKTTTTAILAEVLRGCDKAPRAIVGSQIVGWQGNALTGAGDIMVLEADEYQNKLQYYNPFAVVLTSVDYDHPDFFKTPESYVQAFRDFVARIPAHGFLVACGDSASARDVITHAHCKVITYGFGVDNDVVIADQQPGLEHHTCTLSGGGFDDVEIALRLPGQHNALNATAAVIIAQKLNCEIETIMQSVADFRGARRRFESHGAYNGALLIDDYAHHPEEVRATLAAAHSAYPDRQIIAAFHPHTFTRTKALLSEFAQSFGDADQVVVIDIYGSAREEHGGVSSQDLVDAINRVHPGRAQYIAQIEDLAAWAREHLTDRDAFFTLGAGDIWKVMDKILDKNEVLTS